MKLNLKTIIIAVIIILIVMIIAFNFKGGSQSADDKQKMSEIDTMFAIWMTIAGEGDKKTMLQNEAAIKKDLYDKLTMEEILSLKTYSVNLKTMLDNKSRPLSAEFIGSLSYLTQNFKTNKDIVSKTGIRDIFSRMTGGIV